MIPKQHLVRSSAHSSDVSASHVAELDDFLLTTTAVLQRLRIPYEKPVFGIDLVRGLRLQMASTIVQLPPTSRANPMAEAHAGRDPVSVLIDTATTNGPLRRQRVQTRHDHKVTNGSVFPVVFDPTCISLVRIRRQFRVWNGSI